jgi:hypothetical protein
MRFEELDPGQKAFLEVLDGMIEATGEFIHDDNLTFEYDPDNLTFKYDPDGRFEDLAALNHTRQVFSSFYLDDDDPNYGPLDATETGVDS